MSNLLGDFPAQGEIPNLLLQIMGGCKTLVIFECTYSAKPLTAECKTKPS